MKKVKIDDRLDFWRVRIKEAGLFQVERPAVLFRKQERPVGRRDRTPKDGSDYRTK